MLAELDEDYSGGFEFDEFLKLATSKPTDHSSRAEVNKIFNYYDVNRCGRISFLDLKKVAEEIG